MRPYRFKNAVSQFRRQFEGYQQHDASELLLSIIEGVSEDLNRVLGEKPYVPAPDSFDASTGRQRSDAFLAGECWRNHRRREDHVATALFTVEYGVRLYVRLRLWTAGTA